MKLQIGEVRMAEVRGQGALTGMYKNKAAKYLAPCLKEYGDKFTHYFNKTHKIAIGIGDMVITNRWVKHQRCLFILFDSKTSKYFFKKFMDYVKEEPIYEDDYVYGNIQTSSYHMVVVKFPENQFTAFDVFPTGKYSMMYNKDAINKYFRLKKVKRVLIKDHNYRVIFADKVNRLFQTNLRPEDIKGELDFPPRDEEEVFNHHLKR